MDQQCCPSPDYPIIQADDKGKKLRVFLKFLYYGQMLVCAIKFFLFGPLAGLFQLINLWVIYTAFATLHFCSSLIYFIMSCFELLFIMMDWKRLMQLNDNKSSPLFVALFIYMGVYYALSAFYAYRAYVHYKKLFMQQLGDVYQMHGENADNESQYQEQQRQLRERFFQQQQQRQVQPPLNAPSQALQVQNPQVQPHQFQDNGPNYLTNQAPQQQLQYQPPPQPGQLQQVVVHDMRRRVNNSQQQQQQQQQNRAAGNGQFQPFTGQGYKLQ